ncbi:hypothetical protein M1N79_00275 [Dehalococcoidia bacterium]|nr:hypothetical protein [Dehalococcoidia bacterium]
MKPPQEGKIMTSQTNLSDPKEIKLHNIVDMGLTFSAMMRLFEKGTKKILRKKIVEELEGVFNANSEDKFSQIHSDFCKWGIKTLKLAERKRNGQTIKEKAPASYGQIAKIFDVVLKVVVYYSHLPDCQKSQILSPWLNAAVDIKMRAMLKGRYRNHFSVWPASLEKVDEITYHDLQKLVRKFIDDEHSNDIIPVQFDDIYWNVLNR